MLILMLFAPQMGIIFAISTSNNPIIKKNYAWERWRTSAWYLPRCLPPGLWAPDKGSPGYLWPWPGAASPPQALGWQPPAHSRPLLATGRAQTAGAGGARTPPSWHQLGEKRKCWLWGLKNRPPKIGKSSIFAPKHAQFIFGQVLKKAQRSIEYFKRYSQKKWGEGRICPPFQCTY